MKKLLSALALVLSSTLASTLAAQAAPPPPPAAAALPAPKIVVIDRQAILQLSDVGRDVARQVQGFATQAKADMEAQSKALQTEGQQLQQQVAILAPDAKQQKINTFQAKEKALQNAAQRKEQAIQYTLMKAQQSISTALGPIVQVLMQQRGANMILDKSAVIFANSSSFDITPQAIQQLNQKMSSLKVTLENPPAGPAPAK